MKENVSFKNNGKLKLLIIVGTRPEIIRLSKENKKCKVATSFNLIYVILEMIEIWLKDNFNNAETYEELEKINIIKSKVN